MGRLRRDSLPSYRRHRPSGQAVVTLDSRDIYLGPYRSPESRAKYDRVVAEWLASGHARSTSAKDTATVDEVLLAFWRHAQTHYKKNGEPTSEVGLIHDALAFAHRLYGTTLAKDFGPLALKACRQSMVDATWCRGVVNRATGRIKRAFRLATENELVPPSTFHALAAVIGLQRGRTEAREPEPVRPVPEADIDRILPHLPPRVAAMVQLQRWAAMRPHEVTILRARDLNTSVDPWVYIPESHKSEHHDRERRIFLGPQAQAILRPWLRPDLSGYVFSPKESEEERNAERRQLRASPMTPSQAKRRRKSRPAAAPGECYRVDTYRRAIARACDEAGVPRFAPNRLPHSAATRLRARFGLEALRTVLGHSDASVSAVYAERDFEAAARVALEAG